MKNYIHLLSLILISLSMFGCKFELQCKYNADCFDTSFGEYCVNYYCQKEPYPGCEYCDDPYEVCSAGEGCINNSTYCMDNTECAVSGYFELYCVDAICQLPPPECEQCIYPDQACCNGICYNSSDLSSDIDNCGACGNACLDNYVCDNGTCIPQTQIETCTSDSECSSGQICSSGVCIKTTCLNNNDCSIIENYCVNSECQQELPIGCEYCTETDKICCGGECVNLLHQHTHCGACGHECSNKEMCEEGQCIPM